MSPKAEKTPDELLEEVFAKLAEHDERFKRLGSFKWLPVLDAYEKVALKFADDDEFGKATKILYGKEKGLPFDLVGSNTLIVPKESVECFTGLKFTISQVRSAGGLAESKK